MIIMMAKKWYNNENDDNNININEWNIENDKYY